MCVSLTAQFLLSVQCDKAQGVSAARTVGLWRAEKACEGEYTVRTSKEAEGGSPANTRILECNVFYTCNTSPVEVTPVIPAFGSPEQEDC